MRIRALKPGFFRNEHLCELSPMHRLAFAGLWCCADRDGRLEDRPKRLKADIFPYDDCDMDDLLDDLAAAGFIERYAIEAARYVRIPSWAKHQHPRQDEAPSVIPSPVDAAVTCVDTVPSLCSDGTATTQRMGNGRWEVGNGISPYPLKGVRVTREDRKRAKEIRRLRFGCQHEPRCQNHQDCIEAIALELAEKRATA